MVERNIFDALGIGRIACEDFRRDVASTRAEALAKLEVLNRRERRQPAEGAAQPSEAELRNIPQTAEQLRWQMLTTLRLLRKSELARQELEQRLRKLQWTASEAIHTAKELDGKKRASFEEEARSTQKLLGPPQLRGTTTEVNVDPQGLQKAKVVEVRKDLSLVVLNVGARQGIQLGMPFDIVRDGKLVAVVIVAEVRNDVCGALIERMEEKNPVRSEDLAVLRTS